MQLKKDYKYILTLMFVFCFIYPITAVVETLTVASGWHWIGLLAAAVMLFSGRTISLLIFSRKHMQEGSTLEKKSIPRKVLYSISFLIPVIIALLFFNKQSVVFYIIALLAFYSAGSIVFFRHFYDIFNGTVIVSGAAVILISLFASMTIEKSMAVKSLVFFFVYFYIFLILLLLNLNSLDLLFSQTSKEKTPNNKRIIFYNVITVFIFFLLISFILNMKRTISSIEYIPFVVSGYIILKLRLSKSHDIKHIPEKFPESDPHHSMWITIIINILVILVIVFVIYKKRRDFKQAFVKLSYVISNFIKRILAYLKLKHELPDSSFIYHDESEFVDTHGILGSDNKKKVKIKRTLKALKSITDPSSKIKYIYGMVLDFLLLNKVNIKKSDTADDIHKKAEEFIGLGDETKNITGLYKQVRYGSYIPSNNDITGSETDLGNILETYKKSN